MFLINWGIQFAAQPIHVSRLVEKMYKRTAAGTKKDLPSDIILEDE